MGNKCAPCFGKARDWDLQQAKIQSKLEILEESLDNQEQDFADHKESAYTQGIMKGPG
jgi:hypothetical protein